MEIATDGGIAVKADLILEEIIEWKSNNNAL